MNGSQVNTTDKMKKLLFIIFWLGASMGCEANKTEKSLSSNTQKNKKIMNKSEIAILGGGCFWCTEAVFEKVDGVKSVVSGYAGGKKPNPTYEDICTGLSGHAEVIKITYDPSITNYEKLLNIFGEAHDPTTLNRQGADVGTQYRSTIMFLNKFQEESAKKWKSQLTKKFVDPVVTEIVPAPTFYEAEAYHQDYYELNPNKGYCNFVIKPKLKKLNLE